MRIKAGGDESLVVPALRSYVPFCGDLPLHHSVCQVMPCYFLPSGICSLTHLIDFTAMKDTGLHPRGGRQACGRHSSGSLGTR